MQIDANRYEAAAAQKMLDEGMGEQTELDERAAGRRQSLKDMTYQASLNRYGTDQEIRTRAGFDARRDFQQDQYSTAARKDDQNFRRDMNKTEFSQTMAKAGFDRQTAYGLESLRSNNDFKLKLLDIESRRGTVAGKAEACRVIQYGGRPETT